MNILIVTQYFWPEDFRINDLAVGLIEKGHKVTILTGIPNYPSGKFFPGYGIFKNMRQDYCGARIIRVPHFPRYKAGRFCMILNYFSFAFFSSVLAPFVCKGKYDLIFVYQPSPITVGLPAIILKKFKAAPIFFWVQDLWPESLIATGAVRSKLVLKIINKLVHFIYHRCDYIFVQSKAFIAPIMNFGVAEDRIMYFPNSAEEFYRPVKISEYSHERMQIPKGFIVMFAGNIGSAQDFETIISAAEKLKEHKDIYWVIIGNGRRKQWLLSNIIKLNLTESFLIFDRQPAEKMAVYLSLADVLLVTLNNDEVFKLTIPSKIQSYLACAKPIVAALEGEGARIIEESKSGFSCGTGDPDALAKLIVRMYSTEEDKRRLMGLNGRRYFESNFERNLLLNQLDGIIHSIKKEK